jgi:chorismate-pyruvate lyase
MHETIETTSNLGLHILYPLNEFYEHEEISLPSATPVIGREMPEPYRRLLVHDRDMTPTLEAAYGRKMILHVLKYKLKDEVFSRVIVLKPEGRHIPVVFGAIKIYLDEFPSAARELVLERKLPLGTILESQGIKHFSRPDAFFEVEADSEISGALEISGAIKLFGRRNVIGNSTGRTLAQVLEILPPADGGVPPLTPLFPETGHEERTGLE